MLKPSEQIICIIPPCTGGRKQSLKRNLLPLIIIYILFTVCMVYLVATFTVDNLVTAFVGAGMIFIPAMFIIYKNSIVTFVTLAERIFSALGWQNVKNIDLIFMSKQQVKRRISGGKYTDDYGNKTNDFYIRPPKSGAGWCLFYYDPEVVCEKSSRKN